ncbi:hypothetical protein FJTKL_14288 [Diaporthe vaccinii]|uniref:C2H2-type domain-containing protein n=1 Tax=Diaporthe vaccinii TaxID=105482 RepID=A0ABR4E7X2_9PEZI
MSKANEQIPDLVASNLDGLGRLCSLFESQDEPSQCSVQSYLARFKLWAGSLGAHRTSGARSLEYRLRDASSIRKQLISLLQELKGMVVEEVLPFLESGHDAEGESETEGDSVDDELAALFNAGSEDMFFSSATSRNHELSDLLSGIGNVIDCLLRLSVTISNPAPHDHFRSRAGVELTQAFEHYDTRHVRDKYPNIQPELSERLGRILTYRRRYFRYREEHHSRLMQGLEGALDDGASKGLATTVASSLPQALKDCPQIHLAEVDDDRSEISATSYAPSTLDRSELRIPPIPKQYVNGPFLCPYCYVFISVDSRNDWKKHVFRDLRPYACLVETCLVDHDFPRRKDWTRHMLKDHWRAWNCPFGCVGEYPSFSALRDHLHKSHTVEVMGLDVEAIVNLSSKANVSCAEGPCPLCHDFIKSSHQYQSHVGHHLEELALFVLPTRDDNDDDQECSDDDSSGTSQDIDYGAEETTSPHQMSLEQGAEKRTQSDIDEQDNSVRDPSPPPPPINVPGPLRTSLPAEEKPNPQMEQMKKQLELQCREQEESKKQADLEQKIKEDAERAFKIRMEEMQKAQEEGKKEIELAKIAAERAARERIEKERMAEAERQRQHAEMMVEGNARDRTEKERKEEVERARQHTEAMAKAEREAKEKYEAALKAEEERKAQQEEDKKRANHLKLKAEARAKEQEAEIAAKKAEEEALRKELFGKYESMEATRGKGERSEGQA